MSGTKGSRKIRLPLIMQYYLDTNVLYNITKIPLHVKQYCVYSVYGLSEILAGINDTEFNKRKKVLANILKSGIQCDKKFTEEILFSSYDFFNEYDFSDNRAKRLFSVISEVLKCDSYSQFIELITAQSKLDQLAYFIQEDLFYTNNFKAASLKGISNIRAIRKNHKNELRSLPVNDSEEVHHKDDLIDILDDDNFNVQLTREVYAAKAKKLAGIEGGKEIETAILDSYNGSQEVHFKGYSLYSRIQMRNNQEPGKNDNQDLRHLYYLYSGENIKMVSDDRIFKRCIPDHLVSFDYLLAIPALTTE